MYEWIDSPPALENWIATHAAAGPIFLDTEFMRTNSFYARLALVQIKTDAPIALIDAPRLDRADALRTLLSDADRCCVMHSASEDLDALGRILPAGPARLYDTQIAAAMAGLGFGLSYQKLVAALLDIDLLKGETRSDWLKRPLTASQCEYAAQDVAYLPQLHAQLDAKLGELGRREWLDEDCRRMVERICRTPPDDQPQRAFRGARDWPLPDQALLRRILLWREATARRLDKPRPWVLDDARALSLVADRPADANALFERCKGLRALRSEQRRELLDELQRPLRDDELDIAPIPPGLTSEGRRRLKALREAVARIAAELELPDGLLCPRRYLESLVADGVWPDALEGWRKPLLHDALMARLG